MILTLMIMALDRNCGHPSPIRTESIMFLRLHNSLCFITAIVTEMGYLPHYWGTPFLLSSQVLLYVILTCSVFRRRRAPHIRVHVRMKSHGLT